jgi:hypothetical protein
MFGRGFGFDVCSLVTLLTVVVNTLT